MSMLGDIPDLSQAPARRVVAVSTQVKKPSTLNERFTMLRTMAEQPSRSGGSRASQYNADASVRRFNAVMQARQMSSPGPLRAVRVAPPMGPLSDMPRRPPTWRGSPVPATKLAYRLAPQPAFSTSEPILVPRGFRGFPRGRGRGRDRGGYSVANSLRAAYLYRGVYAPAGGMRGGARFRGRGGPRKPIVVRQRQQRPGSVIWTPTTFEGVPTRGGRSDGRGGRGGRGGKGRGGRKQDNAPKTFDALDDDLDTYMLQGPNAQKQSLDDDLESYKQEEQSGR